MDIRLVEGWVKGKVAVVTGAASGIGFAIAKSMSDAGAGLVLADVSDPARANSARRISRVWAVGQSSCPADISKSARRAALDGRGG